MLFNSSYEKNPTVKEIFIYIRKQQYYEVKRKANSNNLRVNISLSEYDSNISGASIPINSFKNISCGQ